MKVLMLNALYPPYVRGGAERSVQQLAQSLMLRGVEVVVAATVPRREGRTCEVDGARVHFVPMRNLYWPYGARQHSSPARRLWHMLDLFNPLMGAAVAKVIDAEQPDLVHTNNLQGFSTAAWSAAHSRRRPVLHTLRDYSLSCARACRFRRGAVCESTCWDCRPLMAARRHASRRVDGVAGNSADILQRHTRLGFFPAARLSAVIPPSILLAHPRAAPGAKRPFRFGYVGRLEPIKGVALLIDTFAASDLGDCELHIAGTGSAEYERILRHKPAAGGAPICWRGWVDAPEFLAEIDALVVPSLWPEPMPRVILEAFNCGVPVIGADRGGIGEAVIDGESGLLFDPQRSAALRQCMQAVARDGALRARLAAGGNARLKEFTPDLAACRYEQAYRRLLDQRSGTEQTPRPARAVP